MSRQMLCPDTGKIIRWTRKAAKEVRKLAHLNFYRCEHCGYWHLTKQKPYARYKGSRNGKKSKHLEGTEAAA